MLKDVLLCDSCYFDTSYNIWHVNLLYINFVKKVVLTAQSIEAHAGGVLYMCQLRVFTLAMQGRRKVSKNDTANKRCACAEVITDVSY